jgi:hypothetical protein
MRLSENKVLKIIFRPDGEKKTDGCRSVIISIFKLYTFYKILLERSNKKGLKWVEHAKHMAYMRNSCRILIVKSER